MTGAETCRVISFGKNSLVVSVMARYACRVLAGPARGPASIAARSMSCSNDIASSGVRSWSDFLVFLWLEDVEKATERTDEGGLYR